jgi:hypothetical protein
MKTFDERFKDRIDMTNGTVVLIRAEYEEIQSEARIAESAYIHEREIKNLLETRGFNVVSVKQEIDETCSPEIGYNVTIEGEESERKDIEAALINYAYCINII